MSLVSVYFDTENINLKEIRDKNPPIHKKITPPIRPKFENNDGSVNIPTPIVILIHIITTSHSEPSSIDLTSL